ncbi:MAG: winged helix-turn-helix domain-containing protein [Acidimicrobiales bacterium]
MTIMYGTELIRKTAVLLVDAHDETRTAIKRYLQQSGYRVGESKDGPAAVREASIGDYDIVVIGTERDSLDAGDIIMKLHKAIPIPVVIYGEGFDEAGRIEILNVGADSYVERSCSIAELEANVRAIIRNGQYPVQAERLEVGNVAIDRLTHRVEIGDKMLDLTPKEFDLLYFMASHADRVFSREDLLQHVWGSSMEWQDAATVTEHIRRVRSKIEPNDHRPIYVQTVRGVGYRFNGKIADVKTG